MHRGEELGQPRHLDQLQRFRAAAPVDSPQREDGESHQQESTGHDGHEARELYTTFGPARAAGTFRGRARRRFPTRYALRARTRGEAPF